MGQATCASAAILDQEVPLSLALALLGPEQRARVSKKCETGEAIALIRFLDHRRFSMTNNVAERQLHAIPIGHKTWILGGSDERALRTSSIV